VHVGTVFEQRKGMWLGMGPESKTFGSRKIEILGEFVSTVSFRNTKAMNPIDVSSSRARKHYGKTHVRLIISHTSQMRPFLWQMRIKQLKKVEKKLGINMRGDVSPLVEKRRTR
jgi:hypothetical protein